MNNFIKVVKGVVLTPVPNWVRDTAMPILYGMAFFTVATQIALLTT